MISSVEQKLQDPITLHMRADVARLHVDQTLEEGLAAIRALPPEGRIVYFYVVDDEQKLMGVVPTRRMLVNSLGKKVGDIMIRDVVALPTKATVLEACESFTMHRLLAFPVVDEDRRLVGVVDIELYTQELHDLERSQQTNDLFQLVGVHLTDAQQASPVTAFRSRFPWLLTNIAGGILAAVLSGMFEAELQKVVALALFIPIVLALAESVAIQSASLALQVLHGKRPTLRSIVAKVRAELGTGLLLGGACALLVAFVAVVWPGDSRVALCLAGGITGGVTCAAVIGVSIPNLLFYFQRNPQVAAGPIALASADMVTLLIYFSLARWLVG